MSINNWVTRLPYFQRWVMSWVCLHWSQSPERTAVQTFFNGFCCYTVWANRSMHCLCNFKVLFESTSYALQTPPYTSMFPFLSSAVHCSALECWLPKASEVPLNLFKQIHGQIIWNRAFPSVESLQSWHLVMTITS